MQAYLQVRQAIQAPWLLCLVGVSAGNARFWMFDSRSVRGILCAFVDSKFPNPNGKTFSEFESKSPVTKKFVWLLGIGDQMFQRQGPVLDLYAVRGTPRRTLPDTKKLGFSATGTKEQRNNLLSARSSSQRVERGRERGTHNNRRTRGQIVSGHHFAHDWMTPQRFCSQRNQ